jgi:hypothetical protein
MTTADDPDMSTDTKVVNIVHIVFHVPRPLFWAYVEFVEGKGLP